MVNEKEKVWKLAIWMMGLSGGFLLKGNMVRGDDFTGYLSSLMMLVAGLIFVFVKPKDINK